MLCYDDTLLILLLGLGTKTLGKDLEKIMFWLTIPVFVTKNTARDVLMVFLKTLWYVPSNIARKVQTSCQNIIFFMATNRAGNRP